MELDREGAREALLGLELPAERARDVLERAEFGILGLADGDRAYTIPLSFGFDDDLSTLYFLLAFDETSEKRRFLAATDVASFSVVESALPDAWHSVHLTGTVAPVPEAERSAAYATLARTAEFPAPFTFDEYYDVDMVEQRLYAFDVDSVSARHASHGRDG